MVNFVTNPDPYHCKITLVGQETSKEEARAARDMYARMEGRAWYRKSPSWFKYMGYARCTQVDVAKNMQVSTGAFSMRLQRARAWLYPWPKGLEEWLEGVMIQQPMFNRLGWVE